jgi:hypothetical protein
MLKKYLFIFVFSLSIYLAHAIITRQGLYGDGNGYYLYTNTLYFQRNLNFGPIYNYLGNFNGVKGIFSRIFWNRSSDPYTIGTGIVWIPSMAFISAINILFNLHASRFDLIYEIGPGLTGIILIISGLYFLEKYLLNFFSKKAVFWTIITIFFASNVLYFTAFEPALSHQPSFFIICFLLWWTHKLKISTKNMFLLGLLSGFLATVRMVDIILLVPIYWQLKLRKENLLPIVVGGLIGFSPQLINQYINYGSILTNSYLNGSNGTWQFNLIHLFEYLFSPMRGLFLWSPIFLVAFWGLIKSKSKIFLATIFILWLVTSSWSAYLSAGFGQRFSFSAIPYFAFGLAYLFNKYSTKIILIIFGVFTIWNFNLLANFYLHKDRLVQAPDLKIGEFMTLQAKTPFQLINLAQKNLFY